MSPQRTEIERILLRLASEPTADVRLGNGANGVVAEVSQRFPTDARPSAREVMAAVWSLIARGRAFFDTSDPLPANWPLVPMQRRETDGGVLAEEPESLLERLHDELEVDNPTVVCYVEEAVAAYRANCFLSALVNLGLATEAAFLEAAGAFTRALPDGQRQIFEQVLSNPRTRITNKFDEFRKRLKPYVEHLPAELAAGLPHLLDSVNELIQCVRNDADHPVPRVVDADDALLTLQLLGRQLRKLYQLRDALERLRLPKLG